MMIIVSDTTPLRYLIETELIGILPALFGQVFVPPVVLAELQHEKTPLKIKDWVANVPNWMIVQQPQAASLVSQKKIGPGERAAFALALEINADAVLVDDRGAIVEARRHNIQTFSTFALLEQAAALNLLDLPAAVAAMQKTSFRVPPEDDLEAMLQRDQLRKQQ